MRMSRGFFRGAVVLLTGAAPLCASAQGGGAAEARGSVTGFVRDSTGAPIFGVHLSLGALATESDSSGAFRFARVTPGPITLVARRLGFAPARIDTVVRMDPLQLDVRLRAVGVLLAPVRVAARAEPYASRLRGFYERRARHMGYFLGREDIERSADVGMTAALRRLPGVRVVQMPGALGRSVRFAGAHCEPVVYVDGFAASLGSFDLDMFNLRTVEGVEVYPTAGSIPPEFAGTYGGEFCGVIAIWSRPARSREPMRETRHPVDLSALLAQDSVFSADDVDEAPVYLATSAPPEYPDSLYRAHVPGRVVAEFVVDTGGSVETKTVTIVSSSDARFSRAVERALVDARFRPGRRGGHAVRVVTRMPFDFDPTAPQRLTPDGAPERR